jgi:tetratricopeptide (TPR) repeat protein/DNA-binding XRE family transcriptional regulator
VGTPEPTACSDFGETLWRWRRASGLSREELAERAEVGVRTIADLERGRTTRPYRHTVGALADALGLHGQQREQFMGMSRQRLKPPIGAQAATGQSVGWGATNQPGPWTTLAGPARQLPAAVSHFNGRTAELGELTRLLKTTGAGQGVVVAALAGTAGVGKTALAVQWAHQVASQFPDGQLYVDLRGFGPEAPVPAGDALAGFLQSLGVPGLHIPDQLEERAGLYRSRLAGRRMLVLLDNARDGEQVRPMLPGDPGCLALVTSRDQLAGLVAADGARRLDLGVLQLAEAVGLLRSLIGSRVDADPHAAAALAQLCARLPLALRIAAEHAAARPDTALAELAAELTERRLDSLDAGEERANMRAVLTWSYARLADQEAGAFALAGLHPGASLDAHETAALTGTAVTQARRVLGRLQRASLLHATQGAAYGMHDLLRAYAREQAAACGTGDSGRQPLTRLFDYYLAASAAAMDLLFPAEAHRRPRVTVKNATLPAMTGQTQAREWLDGARANLVAVVAHCAGHGWEHHATELATTLSRYLTTGSHLPDALTIHSHALRAARQSGNRTAEARTLNALGGISLAKGQLHDALSHYRAALEIYRGCGDRVGRAHALGNLGITEDRLHNHQSAAGYFRQAIAAYTNLGDRLGAARSMSDLGGTETELGHLDLAAQHLQTALPLLRDENDQLGEAHALHALGTLSLRRCELDEASAFFEQSLATFRHLSNPCGIAAGLHGIGEVCLRRGDYRQSITYFRHALAPSRSAGDQYGEILRLRLLARALQHDGQPAAARAELQTALELATQTGHTYQQASSHRDLAESYHREGEAGHARHHWQQAQNLYSQLGAPEAAQPSDLRR